MTKKKEVQKMDAVDMEVICVSCRKYVPAKKTELTYEGPLCKDCISDEKIEIGGLDAV